MPTTTKKSATKRSDKKDKVFFDSLSKGCGVGVAARSAGYSRAIVYKYRDKYPEFASRWQEAKEETVEAIESALFQRAVHGVKKDVFHRGEKCGEIIEYSDTAATFLLKGNAPDKYRERREVMGKDGGPIETALSFTKMVLKNIDGKTRSK